MEVINFEVSEEGKEILAESSMDDEYYDLFVGGYLRPHRFLDDPEQIALVENAMRVVDRYLSVLEQYVDEE
jgi:hypothetical protein